MSTASPTHYEYDAIVVGARVAGAATALLLARAGARVLVIDRGRYGSDTLSTHALMRGAVLQLQRWGVLDDVRRAGTPPIHSTTFHYDREAIRIAIKPKHGVDALFAPRRRVLDTLLVDHATRAGAEFCYGLSVSTLTRAAGRVTGITARDSAAHTIEARAPIVIGADGLRSTVAHLAGAEPYRVGLHAAAVVYGYWRDVNVDGSQWYWSTNLAAGAIPTNDGETCIFAAVPAAAFASTFRPDVFEGYRRAIGQCAPALADVPTRQRGESVLRGFAGVPGFFRQSWGPGWALVGDAAYFKDPITAHGITDALRDADLLAGAVLDGGADAFAHYQRTRDALSKELFALSDTIASFAWDNATLAAMHRRLSDEMNREVDALSTRAPVQSLAGAIE